MNEPGHHEAMSTSPLMPAPEACSTSAEPARDPRQPSAAAPAAAVAPAAATDSARASAAASPAPRIAVVIGTGGIGGALAEALRSAAEYDEVVVLGRRSTPALDLLDEASIAAAARWLAARGAPELVIDATGILHGPAMAPEKSWRELDPATLAQAAMLASSSRSSAGVLRRPSTTTSSYSAALRKASASAPPIPPDPMTTAMRWAGEAAADARAASVAGAAAAEDWRGSLAGSALVEHASGAGIRGLVLIAS